MAGGIRIQFLVHGGGTDEEFEWAVQFEQSISKALTAAGAGSSEGHDSGSGTINLFFSATDAEAAKSVVIDALDRAGLDPGSVVASFALPDNDEETAWWPTNYPFLPSILGPVGVAAGVEFPGMPGLAGPWKTMGPNELGFLFGGDLMIVRKGVAVVSAARVLLHPTGHPRPIEIVPVSGPSRGLHTPALLLIEGDRLVLRTGDPDQGIPTSLEGSGRMELTRVVGSV